METIRKRKVLYMHHTGRMYAIAVARPDLVRTWAAPVIAAMHAIAYPDGFIFGDAFREAIDGRFSLARLAAAYIVAGLDKPVPCWTRWRTCLESAQAA